MNNKIKPSHRRKARQLAMQAIYQWQMTRDSMVDVEEQFLTEQDVSKTDVPYFRGLIAGVSTNEKQLDKLMSSCLSRKLEELDRIEHAILLIGVYELYYIADLPEKVAINEAIELAKIFASEDSHKFVNGVLDKVLHIKKLK